MRRVSHAVAYCVFLLGWLIYVSPAEGRQIGVCSENPVKRSESAGALSAGQYDIHVATTRELCQQPELLTHPTDCTAATSAVAGSVCWEIDDSVFYVCEPVSGACDSPEEWVLASSGGGGGSGFDEITSGTNTTATMTVGTGASIVATGSGSIAATEGDSATAFFSAGQLEAARGGTGADTSAATGVPRIAAGSWSADAGVSHLAASTSADLAGVLSDETGSGAAVFGTEPTISSAVLTTKVNAPSVTEFPGTPSTGDVVVVTDDSAVGACDSDAGSAVTLCRYNGTAWVALGDGGTGGGGGSGFNEITSGTNTTAAMVVGSGASLVATGTGTITATGVTADSVALGTDTTGNYVSSATASQGLTVTGTEGASVGLQDCAANEILKRNAGDTAWECAADSTGGTPSFDAVTSGTNTTAAMIVGSGASLRSQAGILGVPNSTTLPGTCTVGDVYMDTDATSGQRLYACESTDTWVQQGGGGGSLAWVSVDQNGDPTTGPGWTHSTDVATVDFTGLDGVHEIRVIVRDVTASSSDVRSMLLSTDGGTTYRNTSGDYLNMEVNGTVANNVTACNHGTSATAARGFVCALTTNVSGAVKTIEYNAGSAYRIFTITSGTVNAIRFQNGSTTGGNGNLTGGTITVFVRR